MTIITCPHCHEKNRVGPRAEGVPRCGTSTREMLPHDEFLDVTAELPYEYASVARAPGRV